MKMPDADCDDANTCSRPRLQFDLNFLFTAMSLAVLWVACFAITNLASKGVLAVFALTYLFGCWKTRRAMLGILPAMYVPYAWLVAGWSEWPISQYRWQWIAMIGHLPGLLAEVVVHPLSDVWLQILTSLVTTVLFFTALMIARPSLRSMVLTSLVVLALSLINSAVCYRLYSA